MTLPFRSVRMSMTTPARGVAAAAGALGWTTGVPGSWTR